MAAAAAHCARHRADGASAGSLRGLPAYGELPGAARVNARVAGDIGCYTLAAVEPAFDRHDGLHGREHRRGRRHGAAGETKPIVATIGDSTFLHSGIAPLVDAVYNKANITVVLLDNSIHRDDRRPGSSGHWPHLARRGRPQGRLRAHLPRCRRRMDPQRSTLRDRPPLPDAARSDQVQRACRWSSRRPCVLDPVKIRGPAFAVAAAGCVACQSLHESRLSSITWTEEMVEGHHKVKIDAATCHRLHALRAGSVPPTASSR